MYRQCVKETGLGDLSQYRVKSDYGRGMGRPLVKWDTAREPMDERDERKAVEGRRGNVQDPCSSMVLHSPTAEGVLARVAHVEETVFVSARQNRLAYGVKLN